MRVCQNVDMPSFFAQSLYFFSSRSLGRNGHLID